MRDKQADLLTNATVVEDAMKFVQRSKEKLRMPLSSKNVEHTTESHSKEEEEEEMRYIEFFYGYNKPSFLKVTV